MRAAGKEARLCGTPSGAQGEFQKAAGLTFIGRSWLCAPAANQLPWGLWQADGRSKYHTGLLILPSLYLTLAHGLPFLLPPLQPCPEKQKESDSGPWGPSCSPEKHSPALEQPARCCEKGPTPSL